VRVGMSSIFLKCGKMWKRGERVDGSENEWIGSIKLRKEQRFKWVEMVNSFN